MGTQAERAKTAEGAPYVPARVVSASLKGGKGWKTWATLSGTLTQLAEAAPEALLDAVERDLDADPNPFRDLFDEEGDGLIGGVPHTGLVWALEALAWSPDLFARVAKVLARLAEMDPGGQVSNRPAESLRNLFLPCKRFSEASDKHRLQTLEMLLDTVPRAGWQLLVGAYPSSEGFVIDRRPPSLRSWAQDGAPQPTMAEFHKTVSQMTEMLLDGVGSDADRWADLVGIISTFSAEDRKQAIDLLSQRAKSLREHRAVHNLWTRLRGVMHHHRSHPDAAWAMDAKELAAIEAVYPRTDPGGPCCGLRPAVR